MPEPKSTTPATHHASHQGGCPCAGCMAERVALEHCLAILRDAGEIPADVSDAR